MQTVTSYPSIVGGVIAQIRNQKGLRQEDLAQALGVTQTTLSRIENGQSSVSIGHLRLAAHHLGVAPNQILYHADHNEKLLQAQGMTVTVTRDADLPPAAVFLAGAALAMLLTVAIVGSQQS